jgi:pimeloyl-ACP methyl ester carboxylesterase
MPDTLNNTVPGLSTGAIARPGRQLRWLTAGHGEPPILLVPGAGETALNWLPILPAVADLSTVVAVDRAGLGASDPSPTLSVQSQVDDLAAVLAGTGPAVLVGHSWGGLLVQLLAWQHPESVAGLVLVDPSHEELFAALPPHLRIVSAGLGPALSVAHAIGLFGRLSRPMARRLAALTTHDPSQRAAIMDAYLQAYSRRHQVRMIGRENRLADRSTGLVRRLRAEARWPDVPVIVLTATTGKPARLQQRATELHARVAAAAPRGRQILVERSGHYIHHDRPDAVVEAIAAVLTEIRR